MPTVLFIKKREPSSKQANYLTKKHKFNSSLSLSTSMHQSPVKYSRYMQENADRFCRADNSDSPLVFSNTLDRSFKYKSRQIDIEMNKKYNSYHDLILTSENKKVFSKLNGRLGALSTKNEEFNQVEIRNKTIRVKSSNNYEFDDLKYRQNRSNLYNLEKFKDSPDILNRFLKTEPREPFVLSPQRNLNEKREKKTEKRKLYSLETIKLTDRFLRACSSVEYIGDILEAEAELNGVILFYF